MKIKLLFSLIVFAGISANAQNIDIPDAAFKQFLLDASGTDAEGNPIVIDTNDDNEIQIEEAEAVWGLTITGDMASVVGIEAFTNLRTLAFDAAGSLNDVINLTTLVNLESLQFTGAAPALGVTSLNIQGLTILEELTIADSFLAAGTLDVTGLTGLKNLTLTNTAIEVIDFLQLTGLETLSATGIPIAGYNLTACAQLQSLSVKDTSVVPALLLDEKPLLTFIEITGLTEGPGQLDFSGCIALDTLILDFYTGAGPRYLNLKNGVAAYTVLDLELQSGTDSPLYVCIDESSEGLLPEPDENNTQMLVSSYCSFAPGGAKNTITGVFTFDADSNGCDEADGFTGISGIGISGGAEGSNTFSSAQGGYSFFTGAGDFTVMPQFENQEWFTLAPEEAALTFAAEDGSIAQQDFCVAANGTHTDVEVVVFPVGDAEPGLNATYRVVCRNKGNQVVSGNFTLTYDDEVFDFVQSNIPLSASPGSITWGYTDLKPFQSRAVFATLSLNSPADEPAVNAGDELTFGVSQAPVAGDETIEDNTFTLKQIVAAAYNPIEITCLQGEAEHISRIGEYLYYSVNFQNTGTTPAEFVVVKNVINPEQFDINSLQLMYASHAIQTRVRGNEAEFYFGNINLPVNGKGSLLFKIKTVSTLQENDVVMQQSSVYFDYNAPLQTNEALTTFTALSAPVNELNDTVLLYPNPATDVVAISTNTALLQVELYDAQGRLLEVTRSPLLNVASRQAELYFVKITTEKGSKVMKLLKQ
jgi:uncharacterized repeat protein (TIGR01451 family)